MSTMTLKFGPADHGRAVSDDDAEAAEYAEGYKYEIIDGRLYVSPVADSPEDWIVVWVYGKLFLYKEAHPDVFNYVTTKARIFVPGHRRTTCPEPDITAFRNYPFHIPWKQRRWQEFSPLLTVEVMRDNPSKDMVRNVELFLQVPSIKEYWVFDARPENDELILHVFRRRGQQWKHLTYRQGETYTTRMLPGFELLIDPDQ